MWKIHATLCLLGATAVLPGCISGPVAEMPAGVALAGHWKLDRTLSDDPQVLIAHMREKAWKIIRRAYPTAADSGPPPGGARGGAQQSPDQNPMLSGAEAVGDASGQHVRPRPDPLERSPMMHTLRAALARGDFLTVQASSEEFVLDYGNTVRRFTPGAKSVVSSDLGVADQESGWKGREYVINVRAQVGPNVTESYGLSADGQHLIEHLGIGPAELPAIELKRVYDRTTETAPRSLPTTD